MKPRDPGNEVERLKALHDYEILDSAREREYDDLADLAAHVAGCPIAVVSLIDTNRQWFKSCLGWDLTETPREVSFCAHAILTPEEPLIVSDTSSDPRFASNPLVLGEPKVQFYAGFPLVGSAGLPLGTLCVLDQKPRHLTKTQIKQLSGLARQVTAMMELRRVSRMLARALEQVKTLEGLLPICCQCKAIKSDDGDWMRLERYVMRQTTASFTHGVCPDCAAKLYPDLDLTGSGDATSSDRPSADASAAPETSSIRRDR